MFRPTDIFIHKAPMELKMLRLCYLSMQGFFSDFTMLRKQRIRLVGRTCKVSPGIKLARSKDRNYMVERLLIIMDEPQDFKVYCYNRTEISDHSFRVEGTKIVSIPIMCSVNSKVLKSSAIHIIGTGDEKIKIQPAHAEVINLTENSLKDLKLKKKDWKLVTMSTYKRATEAGSSSTVWKLIKGSSLGGVLTVICIVAIVTSILQWIRLKARGILDIPAVPI